MGEGGGDASGSDNILAGMQPEEGTTRRTMSAWRADRVYGRANAAWLRAGMDAWSLGPEASAVVALRTAKLTTDGGETELMVAEKVRAAVALEAALIGAPR